MIPPNRLLVPDSLPWTSMFWTKSKFLMKEGPDCCSDDLISIHNVGPNMMYVYNYVVYFLRPHGVSRASSLQMVHSVTNETVQSAALIDKT